MEVLKRNSKKNHVRHHQWTLDVIVKINSDVLIMLDISGRFNHVGHQRTSDVTVMLAMGRQ